jgi:DNA-binding response OmpR family regulator
MQTFNPKDINILIVEDETIVALDIKKALKNIGFYVTQTVTNHNDALLSIQRYKTDIVMMDINLKNSKDGIQTSIDMQKIRPIPIIYLTAYCDDDIISRAIATNPIGYLIKPFKRDELKSTIFLGLHKIKNDGSFNDTQSYLYLGDDYYYDEENEDLYCNNIPVRLGIKEKMLLQILIEAKGTIVPFEKLKYLIWVDYISDNTLRTLIHRLRAKLDFKFIHTINTFGCKLTINSGHNSV